MSKENKKNASRWSNIMQNPFAGIRPPPISGRAFADDPVEFYFAYGSNLDVAQMARRCPGSIFIGMATLHGYRWQINDRGVANVVPVGGSKRNSMIEGLLYSVTCQDEDALDRYEGVSHELYQKIRLPVQVVPHPYYVDRPTVAVSHDLAQKLGGGRGKEKGRLSFTHMDTVGMSLDPPPSMYETTALVYISNQFTKDGPIRDEYVNSMRIAVQYAVALGVSKEFVDEVIEPHLGRGAKGKKRGRDAPTEPRMADNNVVKDGQPEQIVEAVEPACGITDCDHRGRLCHLRKENGQPHKETGIRFDADVLALEAQRMTEYDAGSADVNNANSPVYIVVLQEPLVGNKASYSIEAATKSLPLANELAMKHFRDACARYCGSGIARDAVIGPPVVAQQDLGEEPGKCGCFLDNNYCFFFMVTLPKGGGQVRVWVTVQELVV